MSAQIGESRFRRVMRGLSWLFATFAVVVSAGCAELEVGAEFYKGFSRANPKPAAAPAEAAGTGQQPALTEAAAPNAQPALRSVGRPDSVDPAMAVAPEVFSAEGLALWDGTKTLQGVWIAHPEALVARRVRVVNGETGTRVDGAMFRRDPGLSGPQIVVSSEAAERLGLTPGHGTPITIVALAYAVAGAEDPEETTLVAGADFEAETEFVAGTVGEVPETDADAPARPSVTPTAAGEAETSVAGAEPEEVSQAMAAVEAVVGGLEAGSPADAAAPEVDAAQPDPDADAEAVASTESVVETETTSAALRLPVPRPRSRDHAAAVEPDGAITDGRKFIQAGLFSEPENAAGLVEKLRAADLPAKQSAVTLGERNLTRVIVGPYHTIGARDSALETIRSFGQADAHPAQG